MDDSRDYRDIQIETLQARVTDLSAHLSYSRPQPQPYLSDSRIRMNDIEVLRQQVQELRDWRESLRQNPTERLGSMAEIQVERDPETGRIQIWNGDLLWFSADEARELIRLLIKITDYKGE